MRLFPLIILFFFLTSANAEISMAARMRSATQDYEAGHWDKVIALLDPYSEELPNPGLMMLASSYSKTEHYSREVRVLQTLAAKNEKSYEALMLLAQAYMKQALKAKNPEAEKKFQVDAIQTFRACLKLKPTYKPAFDTLLAILLEQKDNTDSRELLVEGLEKFGHRPELMKELCRLDSMDGFVVQAQQSCAESIQASPEYADNYVYLAQSFYDEKESPKAEKQLIVAAKRFPASEFVQWATGTVFIRKKNYSASVRYFGQAVKDDPTSFRSQFGYAQSLYGSGQEKQALPEFVKACKMNAAEVIEPFFAAGARLRRKGNTALGQNYKELAATCHN